MASKKPRNKKYRPRPLGENAQFGGLVAIAMAHVRGEDAAPLRADQTTDLGVAYWLAFENVKTGNASEESLACMGTALNVALILAETGIGAEHEDALVLALDGVYRAKLRGEAYGAYRLDGDGLRAVEHALAVHDGQMQIAKRSEVITALETIDKRVEAGNIYGAVPA